MEKLISVVIPCYNVEGYVGKCLESVLAQTYPKLEVIVIDDGSTDGTKDVITKYMSDKRIKYVCQENSGVSAARNVGIEHASCEYLTFVDSDDWLEPQMYERLYAAITCENADMAVCNYNLCYDDHIVTQYSKMRNETVDIYDRVYAYFSTYCACPKPNNYIWTRLYKTNIIKKSGVKFGNYKLGDDTLFNFMLLPHINKVTFIADGLYNYYQRKNSNVYTVANKCNLASAYADVFDALEEYYKKKEFTEFYDILPEYAYTRLRSIFFYSTLAGMSEDSIWDSIINGLKGRRLIQYLQGKVL